MASGKPGACQLTVREENIKLEQATFPQSLVLARYTALPFLQVQDT